MFFLSLNLLIGWQLSIWIRCKSLFSLLYNCQLLCFWRLAVSTGLFKMIVRVLTTYHTQYTWDRIICVFLFNRTTLQVFVTYIRGALSRSIGATTYSYLKCIIHNTLETGVCSCTYGSRNSQRTPVTYVTKTWSVVLLNKKYIISSV